VLQLKDKLVCSLEPNSPQGGYQNWFGEKIIKSNLNGSGNRALPFDLRNTTINVGRGNPGAIGIDYLANNRGAVEDVKYLS